MPKVPVPKTVVKKAVSIAAGVVVLLATTAAAPGPEASTAELMAYSFTSAAAVIGFVWIVVRLRRIIGQTIVVVAILFMFYLLAKLVVDAVLGA